MLIVIPLLTTVVNFMHYRILKKRSQMITFDNGVSEDITEPYISEFCFGA